MIRKFLYVFAGTAVISGILMDTSWVNTGLAFRCVSGVALVAVTYLTIILPMNGD